MSSPFHFDKIFDNLFSSLAPNVPCNENSKDVLNLILQSRFSTGINALSNIEQKIIEKLNKKKSTQHSLRFAELLAFLKHQSKLNCLNELLYILNELSFQQNTTISSPFTSSFAIIPSATSNSSLSSSTAVVPVNKLEKSSSITVHRISAPLQFESKTSGYFKLLSSFIYCF
jgi:uncharacterized surface protein with fasciclin (FAS1) repeats